MPQLSIIIPVWNLWNMTQNCLESIAKYSHDLREEIEVIVVDNGSSDATNVALGPTLQELFAHRGHVITLAENLGFAKASNIGAQTASGKLLFFLNNDTLFTPNCLTPLMDALLENTHIGIVGPLLLYPDDSVQHAGICFNHALEPVHAYHFVPSSYQSVHKKRPWQAITGAAMLMQATLFKDCGGFHEGYINGFEDLDLCHQIRAKGLQVHVASQSRIYHLASQTPGRFDKDSHNAALLSQRYPHAFYPDYHTTALEEGLCPMLSPDLQLYLTLPKAKEHALSQIFTHNFNALQCHDQLEVQPYWLAGYDLLANHLERFQMWEAATTYRLLQSRLAPLQEHMRALALCAARQGQKKLVESAHEDIQKIQQIIQNPLPLLEKAHTLHAWAQERGDKALEQLFSTWFKTYTQS